MPDRPTPAPAQHEGFEHAVPTIQRDGQGIGPKRCASVRKRRRFRLRP
jgi:hypothetical protein